MVRGLNRRQHLGHLCRGVAALYAIILIAGCSSIPGAEGQKYSNIPFWSGRISISTTHPKPQRVTGSFELSGHPDAGSLTLTSPLGNTLATARWSPGLALLEQGGQTVRYPDIQALIAAALGQPLPLATVFAWLEGRPESAEGWTPDLDQLGQGRLAARRNDALVDAEVRIVLDASPTR